MTAVSTPASSPAPSPASAAPAVRPTLPRTFLAMMAREMRVMRKNFVATFARVLAQPVLFVFVFSYVLPKIGGAGAGTMSAASRGSGGTFSTVLVPGLVGSAIVMQAMMAVIFPLMMELNWQRSITDRALAPLSVPMLAVQKITAAGVQALIGGLLVFPCVLFVHASGQGPKIHVSNWATLVVVLVLGSLMSSAAGLWLGTLLDPQKVQMMFALVLLPMSMLGCVYYPWAAMGHIRWLQILVLVNPMVYVNEGLRAALTPQVGHMSAWAYLSVLVVGTVLLTWGAMRTFTRRVLQ